MAKKPTLQKLIENYIHDDKQRVNNPPIGLVTPKTDPDKGDRKTYSYDPHLDPQLQWTGKTEHTSFDVPTVSLHVHERIDSKSIMEFLAKKERLEAEGDNLSYIYYHDDFPYSKINNFWDDTSPVQGKRYVVQTADIVIKRCLLMTTDPSDLVLDITCGSGTTAYVAEQWGRRWITCDTSRVALTLAKQRLMTAQFDYYQLAQTSEGVSSGFVYKTVPHITLKSIANNEPAATETLYDQPLKDNKIARVLPRRLPLKPCLHLTQKVWMTLNKPKPIIRLRVQVKPIDKMNGVMNY
jgi:hypothetical protein